ncbi:hypothetical protein P154DRAFT_19520 [Amniculicola lignicola CBS 123094]|uniref:Uncharacterized protein n=1 Tax=Amniculicola lignicola CBS 123094 TaxID=1392246 RepID=A0A6A5WSJ2_9PLEO|nr:hypothetical protein P154DRAFT_19520 [Amniculicola lignicola CBS 123094]
MTPLPAQLFDDTLHQDPLQAPNCCRTPKNRTVAISCTEQRSPHTYWALASRGRRQYILCVARVHSRVLQSQIVGTSGTPQSCLSHREPPGRRRIRPILSLRLLERRRFHSPLIRGTTAPSLFVGRQQQEGTSKRTRDPIEGQHQRWVSPATRHDSPLPLSQRSEVNASQQDPTCEPPAGRELFPGNRTKNKHNTRPSTPTAILHHTRHIASIIPQSTA